MAENVTMPSMTPNEEALRKITGNIAIELPDATYRLAASLLVQGVLLRTKTQLGKKNGITQFLAKNDELGEAIIGFVLAAILELVSTSSGMETKTRLAYNLRVQSYQDLGELLLDSTGIVRLFTGILDEEVERAIRLAGVEQKPAIKPSRKPDGGGGEE